MVRRVENKSVSESRGKGEVKTRVEIRTKYRKSESESESVDMLEYKRIETKTGVTIQRVHRKDESGMPVCVDFALRHVTSHDRGHRRGEGARMGR